MPRFYTHAVGGPVISPRQPFLMINNAFYMHAVVVEASLPGWKIASFRHVGEGEDGGSILYKGRKGECMNFEW